jgi:hypothetical protein
LVFFFFFNNLKGIIILNLSLLSNYNQYLSFILFSFSIYFKEIILIGKRIQIMELGNENSGLFFYFLNFFLGIVSGYFFIILLKKKKVL